MIDVIRYDPPNVKVQETVSLVRTQASGKILYVLCEVARPEEAIDIQSRVCMLLLKPRRLNFMNS